MEKRKSLGAKKHRKPKKEKPKTDEQSGAKSNKSWLDF